jgi:hypothetical protein
VKIYFLKGTPMLRLLVFLLPLLVSTTVCAEERIAGSNAYILNEQRWPAGTGVFWMQDNQGMFNVTEGSLKPGPVRCVGSGFSDHTGTKGEGICVFGWAEDTFTWAWQAHPDGPNTWQVVGATGIYKGMTGSGKAFTKIDHLYRAIPHRETAWSGVIEMPK